MSHLNNTVQSERLGIDLLNATIELRNMDRAPNGARAQLIDTIRDLRTDLVASCMNGHSIHEIDVDTFAGPYTELLDETAELVEERKPVQSQRGIPQVRRDGRFVPTPTRYNGHSVSAQGSKNGQKDEEGVLESKGQ